MAFGRVAEAPGGSGLGSKCRELPEKQRIAVTLRFRGDLNHREIGTVMEISEAAARRNVFEGVKRLRKGSKMSEIEARLAAGKWPGPEATGRRSRTSLLRQADRESCH